jgi:uncharacterized flavoprotein (TIGR03862 family)
MASPARKFLFAGRGGLNLTHSEPLADFVARYREAAQRLAPALAAFSPDDLRAFAASLGEDTFVGSSGRVFPKSFKATPLLRAWLRRLAERGVELRARWRFVGFGDGLVADFQTPRGSERIEAAAIVLALGGASWPRLGSDGGWVAALRAISVEMAPWKPANGGFVVAWSPFFRDKFAGAPLKAIALTHGGKRVRGEAVATTYGLEGGAVYALSASLREQIEREGAAILEIDLKPDLGEDQLAGRLARKPGQSLSTALRGIAGLAPVAIALMRESGPLPVDAPALSRRVKRATLTVVAAAGIARAISSAGGVRWSEVDGNLMLARKPGVYLAGEMLDWEAPTGGYLLQACFSTGFVAGRAAAAFAEERPI